MTTLVIQTCGPGTTIQDRGRFGFQRYGVGPAGAMDKPALAQANALVGNAFDAAAIEMALIGMRLTVEGGAARIAVIGGDQVVKVDGQAVAPLRSVTVGNGQTVDIGPVRTGQFGYLAVAGGFRIDAQLGSLSLQARAELGGIAGRACRAGDRIGLNNAAVSGDDLAAEHLIEVATGPIRVLLGPQDDHFTPKGLATFLGAAYAVSQQSDRMGVRFTGEKIEHGPKGYNIVSDGIATGSVQVPGSGEPLVLLADRQTTGGYPKIATVISADHGRLAQIRPGGSVRFAAVSRAAAVAALRAERAALERFRAGLAPPRAVSLDSGLLLSKNLVGGWVSADE